jgi:uncharacterized spore protein YtfJ
MLNQEIEVGKPFKIDERVFYPLVKVFHWKYRQTESYSLSPIALVVVEGEMKYLLPLDEVDSPQELLDMVSL